MTIVVFNLDPDGPVALTDDTVEGKCTRRRKAARHRYFKRADAGSINSFHAVSCEHCEYCDDGGSTP